MYFVIGIVDFVLSKWKDKAIPDLLDCLNIKGTITTTDAMGTQRNIAKKIRQKRADYVLALKAKQGNLPEDAQLYFSEKEHLQKSAYKKTVEKAREKTEKREYWQTDNISGILTRNTVMGTDACH